jgi:hypothetical protein
LGVAMKTLISNAEALTKLDSNKWILFV